MAQSVEGWFRAQGQITQKCILLVVGITLGATLGVIPPLYLILDFHAAFRQLQIWRLVTHMFFFGTLAGPGAFNLLINVYLLIMYSTRLEESSFKGKPADFVWMLIVFDVVLMLTGGYFLGEIITSRGLLLAIVWVWCRHNPAEQLSIFGMFTVQSYQFPWALILLHWVFGQGWLPDVVGVVAGHTWVFLRDILPETHGWRILSTPSPLLRWLPEQRVMGGFGTGGYMPASRQGASAAPPPTTNWGRGRTIGD